LRSPADVIVTQDLCNVCAVPLDDVRAAVARLAEQDVAIVSLHPTKLDEIWDDLIRVAGVIGRAAIGRERSLASARESPTSPAVARTSGRGRGS